MKLSAPFFQEILQAEYFPRERILENIWWVTHLSKTSDSHEEKNIAPQCDEFNFSLHPTIYNNADIPGWWSRDWCRTENINISVSSSNNVEMRTNYQTHRHSIDLPVQCCCAGYFNIFHVSQRLDEYLDSHH